jgi:hypothetical protein
LVTASIGTASQNTLLKEKIRGRIEVTEEEEGELSSYWIILKKRYW